MISREGSLPPDLFPPEGGFLVVDKPRGPSSHQVTAWVRDILGVSRAGHAGTLDPGVSGVLVIAVGRSLRLLPLILTFPKRYVALLTFHGPVKERDLRRVFEEFQGPIFQTPPVRSAVKRERRIRTMHRLRILERHGRDVLCEVLCDSGTYVRTLAVDLGEALGAGAHMAELRRTGTGPFDESMAVPLTALVDAMVRAREGDPGPVRSLLHAPREAWSRFPQVVVKDSAVDALAHGADLAASGILRVTQGFARGATVVLVTRRDELVGIGTALVPSEDLPATPHGWVVDAHQVFIETGRYPSAWGRRRAPSGDTGGEGQRPDPSEPRPGSGPTA